jgi:hypothetical protein
MFTSKSVPSGRLNRRQTVLLNSATPSGPCTHTQKPQIMHCSIVLAPSVIRDTLCRLPYTAASQRLLIRHVYLILWFCAMVSWRNVCRRELLPAFMLHAPLTVLTGTLMVLPWNTTAIIARFPCSNVKPYAILIEANNGSQPPYQHSESKSSLNCQSSWTDALPDSLSLLLAASPAQPGASPGAHCRRTCTPSLPAGL